MFELVLNIFGAFHVTRILKSTHFINITKRAAVSAAERSQEVLLLAVNTPRHRGHRARHDSQVSGRDPADDDDDYTLE